MFPKNSEVPPEKVTYEINGYELFLGDNTEKRGVALYIKDDIIANEIHLLTSYEEAVWCEITLKGQDKLIVGSVYRSPNSGQDNNTELANMLRNIAAQHASHLLIMGDLNFPQIDWINETSPASLNDPNTCFLELVRDNFLHQHIKEKTHFRPGCQPSCIDLVFTNEEGMVSGVEHLAPIGASHHQMLKFKFNCYYIHEAKTRVSYKYDKGDYAKLRAELGNIQWNDILADKSTEEMWNIIEGKLIDSMDNCIPKSKPSYKRSMKKPLWMNKKALAKVKKKKESFQRYLQTQEGKDYDSYAKYRNQAKWECTRAQKSFERKLAGEVKQNPKGFFKYARSKLKTKVPVADLLKPDGSTTQSDTEKAETLNNFYSSVFTNEDTDNIPPFELRSNVSIDALHTSPEEVLKKLKDLKPDKSPGPDGLHPRVLRETSDVLCTPLSMLFNKSFEESVLPPDWKNSHVTPIFKKGPRNQCSNYRPVSLTAIVCKLCESIVRDVIMDHLIKNNLLSDCQHGFIPGRSCVTQLLTMLDMWTRILDDYGTIDVAYLDFCKAFDVVPHERLLRKIEGYGINGTIADWIRSFLSDRKQRVLVNGCASGWAPVTSGIPQGSVLGPLLFLIFINDMPDAVHSTLLMFADDAKVFRQVNDLEDRQILQQDLDELTQWATKWQMKFNAAKCKIMHLGYGNTDQKYYLHEMGQPYELQVTKEEKDLGVIVDPDLTFAKHVEMKVNKANKLLGLIRVSYSYLDKESMTLLFKGLIRPHLEYANVVWSPLYKKEMNLIENVLHRATKMVPECRNMDREARLKYLKLPSMYYRRARGDMIEVYKFLTGQYKVDYSKILLEKEPGTMTRGHCFKLKKRHNRLKIRNKSFGPRVINSWNSLPASVVNASSINSFKNNLDDHWKDMFYSQEPLY